MKRRTFMQAGVLAGTAGIMGFPAFISNARAATPGVSTAQVQLASSVIFSGPLADFGRGIVAGTEAALRGVNASGGIHGREIKVNFKDDGYEADRSVKNVNQFIRDNQTFAFFCCTGTPGNMAIAPLAKKAGIPMIAPYTGATALRQPDYDHIFHVRASYTDEVRSLMQRISRMGLHDVGIAYLDNAFGKGQADDARTILGQLNTSVVASLPIAVDGSDTVSVAKKLVAAKPSCVFIASSGAASTAMVRALKNTIIELPVVTSSVGLTPEGINSLGAKAVGTAITRVFPNPDNLRVKLIRQFQRDMKSAGHEKLISPVSLESYVDMQVVLKGLEDAGENLTRQTFTNALRGIRKWDLGGFTVDYSGKAPFVGSDYVGLGVVSRNGRMIG